MTMRREEVEHLLKTAGPGPWDVDGPVWNRTVWHSSENRVCFMAHSNGLNDDRDMATSRLVAAAPDLARALLAALDDLDAVKAELERDRSQVIDTVNALHSEIAGRQWMLEGRGPYEWDDDRYRDEFAAALGVIKAPIEVLRKIGADWSNCPTEPAAIKAARVNDRARADAAETALAALTAREGVLRAFIDDFATAKIDALRYQPSYGESPEDEPDPVVDATEVWAWQSDAKDILALKETPDA